MPELVRVRPATPERDPLTATGWSLFGGGISLLLVAPVAVGAGRSIAAALVGIVLLATASPMLARRWRTRGSALPAPDPAPEATSGPPPADGHEPEEEAPEPTAPAASPSASAPPTEAAEKTPDDAAQTPVSTPVLAHEIRNPLTAAAGHLDLMAEDPTLTAEQRRSLRTALRGVERASGLIGDYLQNPERWRPGSLFFDRIPVDLRELLLDAMDEYAPLAAERRVTMSVDAPDEVLVRADSRRLRQVVDNLLSNAVKYNQPGGWIDVQLGTTDVDGATHVVMVISNPGTTLSDEDAAQVFDPHFRGSRAQRRAAGHGIGLAVVHDVVTAHGGTVTMDSCSSSRTTTVTTTLPG